MDNDLFSATETLNNAYKEVLKNNRPSNRWGMREMFARLKMYQEKIAQLEKEINSKKLKLPIPQIGFAL